VSPRRASHNQKADNKLIQDGKAKKKTAESHSIDTVTIAEEKLKKGGTRSQREDDRWDRITSWKRQERTQSRRASLQPEKRNRKTRRRRIRPRVREDDLMMAEIETNQEESTRMIVDAQLVLVEEEREQIEEETHQPPNW
jgi:hypothetical protein